MHIVPQTVMTQDQLSVLFWWGDFWIRNWFCFKNGVSSGGLDILSITIRKNGRSVGSISIYFNALIVFVAGYLFGWQYMFYSALSIFKWEGHRCRLY